MNHNTKHKCILGKRHRKHKSWRKSSIYVQTYKTTFAKLDLISNLDHNRILYGFLSSSVNIMVCNHCGHTRIEGGAR